MTSITVENLEKVLGGRTIINKINMKVQPGEVFTLLGPSGCGKTTLLRCIAGLHNPDGGRILLDDEDVTNVPVEQRDVGMVFQNYALFPHMTVFDNIAFGMRLRRISQDEMKRRVAESLDLVQLKGVEDKYPRELSGGMQQRVAMARAIAVRPRVLLFDEPLSNLDAKLREELRFELRVMVNKLGITSVYVTHDQAEALVISDKIAVLNHGQIEQVGNPFEIYARPASRFVAKFIGVSSFIEGKLESVKGREATLVTDDGLRIECEAAADIKADHGVAAIRPEHVDMSPEPDEKDNVFVATVERASYVGSAIDYVMNMGHWTLRATGDSSRTIKEGESTRIRLKRPVLLA